METHAKATSPPARGGLIGALAGGFAWILLLGIAIGSPVLIVGAPAAFLIGYFGLKRPGPVVVWIAAANAAAVNLYYAEIPDHAFGIATNKGSLPLWLLNLCLVGLAGLGIWFSRRAGS